MAFVEKHGKVFFDATAWVKEGRKGLPDGMKLDKGGNLFATGPGGVLVFFNWWVNRKDTGS